MPHNRSGHRCRFSIKGCWLHVQGCYRRVVGLDFLLLIGPKPLHHVPYFYAVRALTSFALVTERLGRFFSIH